MSQFCTAGIDERLVSDEGKRAEPVIGMVEVSSEDVEELVADLAVNPPRKFDLTQRVQVFNAAFQFVEFKLEGCSIARKTVRLPSDLVVAAKDQRTQQKVSSSFYLIDKENERLSGERAMKLKERIAERFLVNLPGYGNVVLRINKANFEHAVKRLNLYVELFQKLVEKELQKAIDDSRKALVEALLPAVERNPPQRSIRFIGTKPDKSTVRNWLNIELDQVFGNAKKHMSKMEVSVIFKDVTYESLNDAKFIQLAKERLPTLPQLHEEFDTAKTKQESPAQENLTHERFFDESSEAVN